MKEQKDILTLSEKTGRAPAATNENATVALRWMTSGISRSQTAYDLNFAEAEKQFRRAIELTPNKDFFYRFYANRQSGQGRADDAIAAVRTAIEINPN